LRQDKKQVTLDFKLPSNEILHFTTDSVVMTERTQIPGMDAAILKSRSPFVKRSHRYELREIINNE